MSEPIAIYARPGVLVIDVQRDAAGKVERAELTVFQDDGARSIVLTGQDARKVELALCLAVQGPGSEGSA